jgi:type III restriction enzyme
MESMQLRGIEKAKIECAEKFFKTISNGDVVYKKIDGYDELIKAIGIKKGK